MPLKLSIGLHPGPEIVERAKLAESLGYDTCWTFDSPALYGDMWIALARVAEQTEHIRLGTAVTVPHLRHVMVTASAIASIESLAPGRLSVAVGTGFTARRTLGKRALPWKFMERFVRDLRGLLRGETVVVDGEKVRMCHPAGAAPARPIGTPILIAANGPRGLAVARELGDGVMSAGVLPADFPGGSLLLMGTVLEEGEALDAPRVLDAIGPAIAVVYHGSYDTNPEAVEQLPGGKAWREAIERVPEDERHLAVHAGHLFELSSADRGNIDPNLGPGVTFTGTRDQLRTRMGKLEAEGCTELIYMPIGSDIAREMRAMAEVAAARG